MTWPTALWDEALETVRGYLVSILSPWASNYSLKEMTVESVLNMTCLSQDVCFQLLFCLVVHTFSLKLNINQNWHIMTLKLVTQRNMTLLTRSR